MTSSETDESDGIGSVAPDAAVLRQTLHDVAQPLTVLGMLLEEAAASPEAALRGQLLHVARTECARVNAAVRFLQTAVSESTAMPLHASKAVR